MDTEEKNEDQVEEQEDSEERARELDAIERDEHNRVVREALGKFGFFLHTTAWLTGCAYLVLLAIFVRQARYWILIPIAIWTGFVIYHGWRAWHPKTARDEALEKIDSIRVEYIDKGLEESRLAEAERIMKTREYESGMSLLEPPGPNGDNEEDTPRDDLPEERSSTDESDRGGVPPGEG